MLGSWAWCGRGNDLRENETITVDPVWVLGVEVHELVEHDVGNGCHAHRSTGMTGIGFGGSIDLCEEQLISMGSSINATILYAVQIDVGRETTSSQLQLAQCDCSEGIAGLYSRPVRGLC